MDKRTEKRLKGLARYWHRKFRLPYDMLDDVISMAWVLWFERPTVGLERRLQQVNSGLRSCVLRELFGKMPHQGKITELRPVFRDVSYITDTYESDFDGRVGLREVVDACKADMNRYPRPDYLNTIAMHAGLKPFPKSSNTRHSRTAKLKAFLRGKGMAA